MAAFDRWGVLFINLGTPDSTDTPDVRRYLRQFLSDPRVLDVNPVLRQFVLNAFILPFRPKESGEAYEEIWTERGSPLMVYAEDLVSGVREKLPEDVPVEFAMRYQNPSVASGLKKLRDQGCDRVVIFPLFPQYSSAAWGSAVEEAFNQANKLWNVPSFHVVPAFYDDPRFLDAFTAIARPVIDEFEPDKLVLSFHGVPERHCIKSDESGGKHCLKSTNCCETIVAANRNCYRAQCVQTGKGLRERLGFDDGDAIITFQSRLGRDPWIKPYTDEVINKLAKSGVKRVAVMCPAFVADCLETIEEIGMRAEEEFRENGGEALKLIPSLNAHPAWIDAVVDMILHDTPVGRQVSAA